MSTKPKNTTDQPATEKAAPVNRLTSFLQESLPLVKATGRPAPVPRGNAVATRKMLISQIQRHVTTLEDEDLAKAEQALTGREEYQNGLAVRDYFDTAPEGAGLAVCNSDQPTETVPEVLTNLGNNYQFVEVAVADNIDPVPDPDNPDAPAVQPVNPICDAITSFGRKGIQSHVLTQIQPRPFPELAPFLIKNSLLGSQPGRDSVQCFIDRVVHKEFDPHLVTAHTPLGAILGRRLWLDTHYHVAEPMDGDRNTGSGAMGLLKGLHLVPVPGQGREFHEEQRATLAMHGINTCRAWSGVGDAVVVTNRSLQEGGESPASSVWASTTRLRNLVQAIFHATAQHEILGAGKREGGPLEKCAGLMNVFLDRLRQEGWIKEGRVTVDYESLTVRISVVFIPVNPVDSILIEWTDIH